MSSPAVRVGPSGPIAAPGTEFWEEIPIQQGVVSANSTLGFAPMVNLVTASGQSQGGLTASVPEPPTPPGLVAHVIDMEMEVGGPAADANPYSVDFIIYTDDGTAGGGAPSGSAKSTLRSGSLSGDGRFRVLASESTLISGQELPFAFPSNGSGLTIQFSVDNNQGYPGQVWQWRLRIKWRLAKS